MMRYNFRPSLLDHSKVLILVRPFFTTSDQDYNYVLNKLSSFTQAQFEDCDRTILLKFTKGYSRDTLEWGRLQLHRRPLGFIGVARLSNDPVQQPKDYEKIEQRFDNLISQYDSYLYDSRCIIVGPENPNIKTFRKDIHYMTTSLEKTPKETIDYICEFITSIFVILESKRVDKISENFERMVLPSAPNEQEQMITETDSRSMKRKCLGRNKKILGDLCLLAGLYKEALMHYSHSAEHLRSLNDYLWIGGALEGVCAAWNAILVGNKIENSNSSVLFIEKSNININVTKDDTEDDRLQNYLLHSVEEIYSKYSECLSCYKRYTTGPVELEAHFKFIRVLLNAKKKIEISQVIQSLLVLPLTFNDNEKIEFTCMLASIYEQIGLHRKAAFYLRRTAIYYKDNSPSKAALTKAKTLLEGVSSAYRIAMNSKDETDFAGGWGAVQLTILLEMLEISRGLDNKLDSVRLLCFILEKYPLQLNKTDHNELVDLLEEYSDDTEPLLNEGSNETDVQLMTPLPIIRDFLPKKLSHHLQPLKSKPMEKTGPFIFSSLSSKSKKDEEDTIWVSGDVSEVAMVVDNPLPAEIKVNNMTLITEGISFEAHPATLALPAQSGSFPFMLLGTPSEAGNLIIKGYKVEVLGISNTVHLPKPITVEVTPVLPILKLSSTLPRAPNASSLNPEDKHYQTLFTSANLYRGHSCNGKISLENAGKVPVTKLDVQLKKAREKNILFDDVYVQSMLPLPPGESLHLDVTIMPESSWKQFNNQDKIQATLIMTYSCEEGNANGYLRQISSVTYVKVMPSLEISNYEILEIERHPSCCMIRFDAVNMTSVPMNVTSKINLDDENLKSEIDISGHGNCLQRKKIEFQSKKKKSCEIHFPRVSLPPSKYKMKTMEDVYEAFVTDSVTFSWILSDTNYSGVAFLQNLKIVPEMTAILKPKHLNINIRVNDNQVKEGGNIHVDECKMMEISVILTNSHEMNLENMALHINPYQECYRSQENMKELYVPSGILTKGIKKLCPGETYEHTCGMLFLYHGKYMIDISCSIQQKFGSHISNRQRAVAVTDENIDNVDSNPPPLSPRTVTKKLKANEMDFWAQSFCVNVQ